MPRNCNRHHGQVPEVIVIFRVDDNNDDDDGDGDV
jgi:hypothetical protein